MARARSFRAMLARPSYSHIAPRMLEQPPAQLLALPGMAYSPSLNRAALKGAAAVKRLAQDMRELAAAQGGAVDVDLQSLGWPKAAIAVNAEAARTLAQQLSVRELT